MTSNQKPAVGFGFGILKNPRIRIFSKCIQKLAPRFNIAFFPYFAQTNKIQNAPKLKIKIIYTLIKVIPLTIEVYTLLFFLS